MRSIKVGTQVLFKSKSSYSKNNSMKGPFTVSSEVHGINTKYIAIEDKDGKPFANDGEGLWHPSHFEPYSDKSAKA
jgi:hypothetical protein